MERLDQVEFSQGDPSHFIAVLQEWHTTEKWTDEETVRAAITRLRPPARDWALRLDASMKDSAEAFIQALADQWPPGGSGVQQQQLISCPQLKEMKQSPEQTIHSFIDEVSFRAMQHILMDCHCCQMYSALEDNYDKVTAMVYDIAVQGTRSDLKPFLMTSLQGNERFSESKRLLRVAATKAQQAYDAVAVAPQQSTVIDITYDVTAKPYSNAPMTSSHGSENEGVLDLTTSQSMTSSLVTSSDDLERGASSNDLEARSLETALAEANESATSAAALKHTESLRYYDNFLLDQHYQQHRNNNSPVNDDDDTNRRFSTFRCWLSACAIAIIFITAFFMLSVYVIKFIASNEIM